MQKQNILWLSLLTPFSIFYTDKYSNYKNSIVDTFFQCHFVLEVFHLPI